MDFISDSWGQGLIFSSENSQKYLGARIGWFHMSGPGKKAQNMYFLIPVRDGREMGARMGWFPMSGPSSKTRNMFFSYSCGQGLKIWSVGTKLVRFPTSRHKICFFSDSCGLWLIFCSENSQKYLGARMGWFHMSGTGEKTQNMYFSDSCGLGLNLWSDGSQNGLVPQDQTSRKSSKYVFFLIPVGKG